MHLADLIWTCVTLDVCQAPSRKNMPSFMATLHTLTLHATFPLVWLQETSSLVSVLLKKAEVQETEEDTAGGVEKKEERVAEQRTRQPCSRKKGDGQATKVL